MLVLLFCTCCVFYDIISSDARNKARLYTEDILMALPNWVQPVAIGMAAQQSARTGQAVSLPQSPVTAAQVVGL